MQTFLPYPNFQRCAKVLDRQRLGKQRVEALQILRTLCGEKNGWRHHPAVRMWKGYEYFLFSYIGAMCTEWRERGYKDTCEGKAWDICWSWHGNFGHAVPTWLGNRRFHESHRSNLLRKLPEHYRVFWPRLRDDLPYVWPV